MLRSLLSGHHRSKRLSAEKSKSLINGRTTEAKTFWVLAISSYSTPSTELFSSSMMCFPSVAKVRMQKTDARYRIAFALPRVPLEALSKRRPDEGTAPQTGPPAGPRSSKRFYSRSVDAPPAIISCLWGHLPILAALANSVFSFRRPYSCEPQTGIG